MHCVEIDSTSTLVGAARNMQIPSCQTEPQPQRQPNKVSYHTPLSTLLGLMHTSTTISIRSLSNYPPLHQATPISYPLVSHCIISLLHLEALHLQDPLSIPAPLSNSTAVAKFIIKLVSISGIFISGSWPIAVPTHSSAHILQ